MSELPATWHTATIGEVARLEMGQSPDGKATNLNGDGLPLIGGAADYEGEHLQASRYTNAPTKVCAPGDLVLCIRATIGRVAVADRTYCLGRGVTGLRPVKINSEFLRYFLKEQATALDQAGTGSTFRQIDKKTLVSWPIPLPPLDEQRLIVAKLDSLFAHSKAARAEIAHVPRLVERTKQAVLADAFSGKLTSKWRETYRSSKPERVTLGSVASGFSYGSSAKSHESGAVPVLRMGNIQSGLLDWDDLVFTSDPAEIAKYLLEPGDILFNRTNSPALVGKTALYRGERKAIYAGYLIRIRCSPDILPEFLTYCLNSPIGRDYCWRVKSDGVSQSNINSKKLAAFSFDLPSLPEQREIVRRIEAAFARIDRLADEACRATALLDRLEQATLAKAFRGELLTADPTAPMAEATA